MTKLAAADRPVILIVEDNPADRDLLVDQIEQIVESTEIVFAESLETASEVVQDRTIDAAFLDLGLPDSQGLDTFHRLRRVAPQVPILVMTGMDREATAMTARQAGAEEYLVKGRTAPAVLERALDSAITRGRMLVGVERDRRGRDRDRAAIALLGLTSLAASGPARGAAPTPIRERDDRVFRDLVTEYSETLELSLESWSARAGVGKRLRTIAEILVAFQAAAADVVDVHRAALDEAASPGSTQHGYRLSREADFILMELLGHLVHCYREQALAGTAREAAGDGAR